MSSACLSPASPIRSSQDDRCDRRCEKRASPVRVISEKIGQMAGTVDLGPCQNRRPADQEMQSPINLALFIDDLGVGGTQTWLALLVRELAERGFAMRVFSCARSRIPRR